MTVFQARKWLVVTSLAITAGSFTFFVLAPVFGYPLKFTQAWTILQIVSPVFLGYLGAATQYAFNNKPTPGGRAHANPLMDLLVKGPVGVFCLMLIGSVVAFGYSNRADARPDTGMSLADLSNLVTAALGLLAVTTNVIVAYLFSVEQKSTP
jgi:hypothetical protein